MQEIKEFATLTELLDDLDEAGIIGVRRKRIIDSFFTMKAKMKRIPYNGGFELTPFCNLDCKMCYVHLDKESIESNQKLLTVDQWIHIMQQAVDAGMQSADLTGGECLTYPGFKDIYLFLLSQGIKVSVLTNGCLLTDEMVEFFSQYKPETVQMSVYGSNDDAYERVTGHRVFHKVIAGIERLQSAGIHIKISITPNKYMKEDASALIELVRSLGVEYMIGSVTLPARPETGRQMEEYVADSGFFEELRRKEDIYYAEYRAKNPDKYTPYTFTIKGFKREGGIPCGSGRCGFHINWKGEMTPCIPFHTVRFSALELGFNEAWKCINHAACSYVPPSECATCEYERYCSACPAEKTLGLLRGELNPLVCEKMKLRLEAPVLE